jgi:penicillin-binding protein 1A
VQRAQLTTFIQRTIQRKAVLWSIVAAFAVIVIGLGWFVHDITSDLPDDAALRGVQTMAQATTLLDDHDQPVFTLAREQRIEVPLSRMSPNVIHAILAIEDQRFYQHGAVDPWRVIGAAMRNLRVGRAAEGGSTLTQQLARQSFLTADKTLRRKLREVVVAERLERRYSKNQILELYLNKVYFGDGLYGVEAASLGYFGAHAADLSVPQAALLAGLVKSPSSYAPTVSPDRATSRRNLVLQQMQQAGYIDQTVYDRAVHTPLHLHDGLRQAKDAGEYFKEEVRKQLVDKFGAEQVYMGGLRVYTTLDLSMQRAADAEVQRQLKEIEDRQASRRRSSAARAEPASDDNPLQAALVAMDPKTGEVRALVGGRDFDQSPFDRATQARRQPGSAFKPFIYAAAIEQGYSPATLIGNLDDPVMTLQGAWVPEDEHLDSPTITMRAALRTSSNRAAVQMLQEIGIPSAVRYAEKLGIGSVPSVPSLALGSGEVTLMSMTTAYAAFANEGLLPSPIFIRRVETRDGKVLFTANTPPARAMSEGTAFLMTNMMADVINSGTAWTARRTGFTLPAAGKTGTTNDYHDAWFVGFTPAIVTGVWIGYDQPRTIVSGGYAAELAVPLWARFMMAATKGDKPVWFSEPDSVTSATICRLSGKLATDACRNAPVVNADGTLGKGSNVYTEYFIRGTEPTEYCPLHTPAAPVTTLATTGSVPPAASVATPPRPTPAVTPSPPVAVPPPEQPKKKRGFWSKLFGIGGDDHKDNKK